MKTSKIEEIYFQRMAKDCLLKDDDDTLAFIEWFIPKNKNINILDAGCGTGKYAIHLSKTGYTAIHCIDLFKELDLPTSISYSNQSIDSMNFEAETFDFIYSNSVIYYLDNPENGIKELNRVLKTQSKLLFTFHTKFSLFTLERVVKRMFKSKTTQHLEGVVFRTSDYYLKVLRNNGFEIIHIDGIRTSYLFYRLYYKFSRLIKLKTGIQLPLIKTKPSENKFIAWLKSNISYHGILIAKKINNVKNNTSN